MNFVDIVSAVIFVVVLWVVVVSGVVLEVVKTVVVSAIEVGGCGCIKGCIRSF